MNKNLKKILGLSLIMVGTIAFNATNTFAYHNDDEQQEYTDSLSKKYEQKLKSIQRASIQNKGFTVVIDAGHGGKDSGATNKGLKLYEKNLNLDIAKAIEKRLSNLGINVIMTRTNDTFLELYERSAIANSKGADLFVSVHNDTSQGNGDGAHIIHSVHDKNSGMSKTLATNIGNSIKSNTTQNLKKYSPIWSRYNSKKNDDYYSVIRQTQMPAVIVEHAFMNNNDIQAVDTPKKRTIMGNAVADGIYKTIKENFSGWMKYKNKWVYYQGAEKIKATGWKLIDGVWYYFNENGLMQKGWNKVDNIWYYLNESGAMQKGWKKINNVWYYLNEDGSMHVGWKKINNVWYYLDGNGAMQTGWLNIGNNKYYLKESGEMVTGKFVIDLAEYYFDGSGKLVQNYQ